MLMNHIVGRPRLIASKVLFLSENVPRLNEECLYNCLYLYFIDASYEEIAFPMI